MKSRLDPCHLAGHPPGGHFRDSGMAKVLFGPGVYRGEDAPETCPIDLSGDSFRVNSVLVVGHGLLCRCPDATAIWFHGKVGSAGGRPNNGLPGREQMNVGRGCFA